MPMKNPSHPGAIVRYDCLEPLGLSVTEAARVLGVTRQTLNNLVNGKAGVSAEMAVRLSKAFGSEPEFWLRLQMNYDLARVRRREAEIDVKRLKKASQRSSLHPHARTLLDRRSAIRYAQSKAPEKA